MYIIGISAFYHDSAVSLIRSDDGKILFGLQEERLSRIRHDSSFPKLALKKIKQIFNIENIEIEAIVFYEKPFLKLSRVIDSIFANPSTSYDLYESFMYSFSKKGHGFRGEINDNLGCIWKDTDFKNRIFFNNHHLSHASSAYYNAPFDDCAIVTIDGVGEWDTYSLSVGKNSIIDKVESIKYPNSIGIFYSAFTAFCGFKANSGEYKFMGLAPFGKPVFSDLIQKQFLTLNSDGTFKLKEKIINPNLKHSAILENLEKILGHKRNEIDGEITEYYANIASSVQIVSEKCIVRIIRRASKLTKKKNLCLAGGVALNCVANQKIVESNIFEKIFVFPASGDAGASLGAAQSFFYKNKAIKNYTPIKNFDPYIGTDYKIQEIETELLSSGAEFQKFKQNEMNILIKKIVNLLNSNLIGGVFFGKCEFGPRALGARSIIGNPTDPQAQIRINSKTKFRESFRPFAPVVLKEDAKEYFDIPSINSVNYEHMLYTVNLKNNLKIKSKKISKNKLDIFKKVSEVRSKFPSITHVDYSARVQTVDQNSPKYFYHLLKEVKRVMGHSVLINTSFNVRGEPIVESPSDAFRTFMATDLDFLVFENFLLLKEKQKCSQEMFTVEFKGD